MNHSRRRQRHEAAPDDPGDQLAAATGLGQADDLLPAEHFDAGGHPRDSDHLNPQGSFTLSRRP